MHISTKCSVAAHCLIFIHEYGDQVRVTSELLSRSTGVNAVTVRNILSGLKKAGILSVKAGTGGAELLCPPREISLYRVCAALEPDFLSKLIGIHSSPAALCPVGNHIHQVLDCSYQKIREDLRRSLERITLEQILADYHRLQGEPAAGTDTLRPRGPDPA